MSMEQILWAYLGIFGAVGGVLGIMASVAMIRGDRRN